MVSGHPYFKRISLRLRQLSLSLISFRTTLCIVQFFICWLSLSKQNLEKRNLVKVGKDDREKRKWRDAAWRKRRAGFEAETPRRSSRIHLALNPFTHTHTHHAHSHAQVSQWGCPPLPPILLAYISKKIASRAWVCQKIFACRGHWYLASLTDRLALFRLHVKCNLYANKTGCV